jgi:hypothetical protein
MAAQDRSAIRLLMNRQNNLRRNTDASKPTDDETRVTSTGAEHAAALPPLPPRNTSGLPEVPQSSTALTAPLVDLNLPRPPASAAVQASAAAAAAEPSPSPADTDTDDEIAQLEAKLAALRAAKEGR